MLFLATVILTHDYYMGSQTTETVTRIVEADDAAQGRGKVEAAFRRDDPMGHSIRVTSVELHETIT